MYATLDDMTKRFGTRRLAELISETGDTVDAVAVENAIADAVAEIDSYLLPRHQLPLPTVPARLVSVTCDLALYRLHQGERNMVTEQVQQQRDQALTWLRELAAGKVDLGLDTGGAPVQVSGGARLVSAGRMFSRHRLRGL
ncbi:DUF1320 domain-containing protein [Niveispirillum sp. SYP-B3756]|uniref:gp436 family protein n=1 Tax=Niveispirillum sp. SYP-B3756 TaxID=2662178 RepID=UPI001563E6D5|nr:DUF1320 domain-containing protein [Niveispirillum sp. SYP-B3756]